MSQQQTVESKSEYHPAIEDWEATVLTAEDFSQNNQAPSQMKILLSSKRFFPRIIITLVLLVLLALVTFSIAYMKSNEKGGVPTQQLQTNIAKEVSPFPRILWIVCDRILQGLYMKESLTAKHAIEVARRSGYEVRIVGPIDAYDWLSPHAARRIRQAKHTSQLAIEVVDLLRIALLAEHGGVSIKPGSLFFTQGLGWIQDIISLSPEALVQLQQKEVLDHCPGTTTEMVLFEKGSADSASTFDDEILIARRNAILVQETFEEMIDILIEGEWPYTYLHDIGHYNNHENAIYMISFFARLISFKKNFWANSKEFCRRYGTISIKKGQGSFMKRYGGWIKIARDFLGPRSNYFRENGPVKVIQADFNGLFQNFLRVVREENLGNSHNNSFFREIINAEGNKWLLTPLNKKRDVNFCVISLKLLNQSTFQGAVSQSIATLKQQSYIQWKAVFFVHSLSNETITLSESPSVKAVNGSDMEGLNLQRAATKHCDPKDIAILLDHDQKFQNQEALSLLSNRLQNKDIYGVFLSTKVKQTVRKPQPYMNYKRLLTHTNQDNFQQLVQHFRVFTISGYRMVPVFDLHSVDGRYYNRELPLYTLVQSASNCNYDHVQYFLKDVERRLDIPKNRAYMPQIIINMPAEKSIDFSPPEYRSKFTVRSWCQGVDSNVYHIRTSLDNFFVMNNGSQFVGGQNRKHLPQLIPKKIHQVWIGNRQMMPFKKIFMDNIKRLHPQYEYTLWGNDNITRENFPATYDVIQMLLKYDKVSPVRKVAGVADFMRLQIIYRHGGFYMDTNYHIFKNHTFDDWLTFQAVMPGQLIPNYKQERQNGFFGAAIGHKNIGKLLDHRYLSTRNLFDRQANVATGPFYFAQSIQGEEELDEKVLVLPQDYIYPFFYDSMECIVDKNTPPDKLIFKNKYAYTKDCENIYDWAFGIDFMQEGRSWRPN